MREKVMRKQGNRLLLGMMTLLLAILLGLFAEQFTLIGHAQSQAKVSVKSAKIRKEASATSEALASVAENDELTVTGQIAGSDGNTWYQVFVNADTKGYIRSDLLKITDGTKPPTLTAETAGTTTADAGADTAAQDTTAESGTTALPVGTGVTAVNPVSATTTAANVRVRASASTGGQIVASVEKGFAVTVIGTENGSDGKIWYQVSFNSNGSDVTGFIRSDLVDLSGELVPVQETQTDNADASGETPQSAVDTSKDWDTQYDDKWYLVDNAGHQRYDIQQFFDLESSAAKVQKLYDEEHKQVKKQKVVVVILVVLLLLLAAAITFLIFKLKDLRDALDFAEVEKNGAVRRTADRPMPKRPPTSGRPAGNRQGTAQRPAGGPASRPQGGQAQRPQGQAGTGNAQRAQAQRPQGQAGGAGNAQRAQAQRPQGQAGGAGSVQRPQAQRPQGQAGGAGSVQRAQAQRPQATGGQSAPKTNQPGPANRYDGADDEFEFEFLNWDGNEEL